MWQWGEVRADTPEHLYSQSCIGPAVFFRCVMGSLTVPRQKKRGSLQKSKDVVPGVPGAPGGHAVRPVGLECRTEAATAPCPGSPCCSIAQALSTSLRPASPWPAQVSSLGHWGGAYGESLSLPPSPPCLPSGRQMELLVPLVCVLCPMPRHCDTAAAVPPTPEWRSALCSAPRGPTQHPPDQ